VLTPIKVCEADYSFFYALNCSTPRALGWSAAQFFYRVLVKRIVKK
jgi:hypothetical protein